MTHDDLCINESAEAEQCFVCELIARVRRDEQDIHAGELEMDAEDIKDVAYAQGFEAGKKAGQTEVNKTPIVNTIDLDVIKKYVLDHMTQFSLAETNALYGLYTYLGGK